jgi:thioredoxin-related protein
MRIAIFVLVLSALTALAEPMWSEDFPASLRAAKSEKKRLLVNFTGSDWCALCKQLEKGVLASPEFAALVKDRFVLVKLDFPRGVTQPETLKEQNREMMKRFRVVAFPTFLVLDANGTALGTVEVSDADPAAFLQKLSAVAP